MYNAGILEALYTDSSEHSVLGKISRLFGKYCSGSILRLASRKVSDVPKELIYSTDIITYKNILRVLTRRRYNEYEQWCHLLSGRMISWINNNKDVDYIYNMFAENLEFIKHIKHSTNIKVITDVYVHPNANNIIKAEQNKLGVIPAEQRGIQNLDLGFIREVFLLSDTLLCPSTFVAEGVRQLDSALSDRIIICPYGSSIDYSSRRNVPIKGRILWAGGDWVRKGLHVLAAAATILSKKYPDMEFRVAGITKVDNNQSLFADLTFLGKLDQDRLKSEFLSADMFVLPTFAEGMASVVIEALSAGCPVITTTAAGVDGIIDGTNGYLVPIGNVDALTAKIEDLYLNRALRNTISQHSVQLSNDYTLDKWEKRLLDIFKHE